MSNGTSGTSLAGRRELPYLGHGIGLRRRFFGEILETPRRIDWLEIIPENHVGFGGRPRHVLREVAARWPVVMHGVSINLGGPDPLDVDFLGKLKVLADELAVPWMSDHLSFSASGNAHHHDLIPLPFTEEAALHVATRIRRVRDVLERPFLIENPSTYALMPGGEMDEAEFTNAVLEEADAGFLLDINNVFVNAHNHGFDPYEFLDKVNLDRVVQVHMAGHRVEGDLRIDDHGSPAIEPVWDLYCELIRRIGPVTTLFEWDNDVPPLDVVLDEADKAREHMDRALAESVERGGAA